MVVTASKPIQSRSASERIAASKSTISDAHLMHAVNAYFCDSGDRRSLAEYIGGYPRYEDIRFCNLVFAESRGKAKSMLLTRSCMGCEAEFIEVSARLVAKAVDRLPGPAKSNDPLWDQV